MTSWVIFTDLDGTLLDAETYSWELARPTLNELKARSIPVIFCTSKTRAETETLQKAMNIHDPFIVESGGAICFPKETIVLGTPHEKLVVRFRDLKKLTGGNLRGFSELSDEELAQESGLTLTQASLARLREYDEPFVFLSKESSNLPLVQAKAAEWGLRVTRGGRYWHLHGPNDKGVAVKCLLAHYPGASSIGLGDSALDLPLLQAVKVPVALARPDGTHDPILTSHLAKLHIISEPGPAGWSRAIGDLVLGRKVP